ncbi:hypothetical protein FRB97_009169 [Tulasnella sp. 331]|nr:hypothetical protein FRB97_009169 [Tulasnella sp. 331]
MSTSILIAAATVCVTATAAYYRYARSNYSLPLPPGPVGDWIIGNLRQKPSSYPWLTFAEWGRKYGPLTYLNIAGRPVLILNTHEAAIDLLEKRSEIYSDRPPLVMAELSAEFRKLAHDTVWKGFNMVKRQIASGTAPNSFVSVALEEKQADEETIAAAAFTLFRAGSETTSGALTVFMLAMLLYPDVQARARAELDRVFGNQLPNVGSRASTPYLNAIVLETLRWHPTLPTGLPHRLMRDDLYNGHRIPAGTMVIFNTWGILNDETRFSNPSTFNPGRYLSIEHVNKDDDGKETSIQGSSENVPLSPWDVAFGYGRRSCQGISFAESGLWIVMATVLATLEILPKIDPKTMTPIIPDECWEDGPSRYDYLSSPLNFGFSRSG